MPVPSLRLALTTLLLALLPGLGAHAGEPASQPEPTPPRLLDELTARLLNESTVIGANTPPDIPPEIVSSNTPDYPALMRRVGNTGLVTIRGYVNAKGRLARVWVLESSHPVFETATLDAVLNARYKPAQKDGQPVAGYFIVPFEFSFRPRGLRIAQREASGKSPAIGSWPPFNIPPRAAAGVPEDYRYDEPPVLTLVTGAVYPLDLLRRKVTGSAQVALVVDPDGRVRQTRVLEATHPDFGHAAAAMLETWRFKPAKKNGQPNAALLRITLEFDRSNRDTAPDDDTLDLLDRLDGEGKPLATAEALDRLPRARVRPLPVAPRSDAPAETVRVEFVVDAAGRVHLPRVVGEATSARAWSALTAVKRWRFDPPRVGGQPVAAVLRLPFEFKSAAP